jgi:hypothetical protein
MGVASLSWGSLVVVEVVFSLVVAEHHCWFLFGGWLLAGVVHSSSSVAHPVEVSYSLGKLLWYDAHMENNFLYVHIQTYIHTYICVCACVCTYVCLSVCMYYIYIYIHT